MLVRQRRAAGVFPCGEPVGADVGGGAGELADERGRSLIVEVVVVFVVIGGFAVAGVAIGEKNGFEPTMCAEAGFEGVICGVADENRVVGAHGKKRGVAVDEGGAETFVDAGLRANLAVHVVGGVER